MKNLFTLLAVTFLTVSVTAQSLNGTWNITNTKVNNSAYGTTTPSQKVHFNSNNFEVQFCDANTIMYAFCTIGANSITPGEINSTYFGCGFPEQDQANGVISVVFGCQSINQSPSINTAYNAQNNTFLLTRSCGGLTYQLTLSQGTSGIEDNYFSDSQVYPNPTTGLINVTNYPVDLFDQYGAKVTTITTPQFDLSSLPKGLYFIANKKVVLL